jgi:hypothetical protein
VLAAAAGDLAAEAVDDGAAEGSVLSRAQAPSRLLHLPHGALKVAPGEDDVALLAGIDHGVGVRESGGDGLVGGNTFDAGLGAGDDGLLHELRRRDDDGEVRRLIA